MEFTQLTLTLDHARATLTINGFTLFETNEGIISRPIDLFLIENNTLTLTITPEKNAHVTLRVATAAQGTMIDTTDTTPGLLNIDEDVPAQKTYTLTLKTPGKTLGKRLLENPLNQQQALDYAKTLAQLINTKNYDQLKTHFQPKFEDYAALYQVSAAQLAQEFITFLKELTITINPNAITVQPHCQGRVYQLIHNNNPFITAKQELGELKLDVYIANVNGLPKVIR